MRQVLRPGALGRPRGIGWRGRWEGGPGWGIHVKKKQNKKLCPQGTSDKVRRQFRLLQLEGAIDIQGADPRNPAQHPILQRQFPTTKSYLPPNITRAKIEIPWSKHVLLFDHFF